MSFKDRKKFNLKSICITKVPEDVSFEEIKEVCATYGQIHTVHETVKNCTYSFINFEFLENEDGLIAALSDIGVEGKRGQRKPDSQPISRKLHLVNVDDLKVFDEVGKKVNQLKLESLEDWNNDNDNIKVDSLNIDSSDTESVSVQSSGVRNTLEYLNSIYTREKESFPEKKRIVPTEVTVNTCVHCKGSASLVCRKCGDYYCSRQCQESDWPSHRYICFTIP